MLEALNLNKKYGEFVAVEDISFRVKRGEVLGIIGENGAGKSTTLKIIVGLIKPTSGDVFYDGERLQDNLSEIRKKIGYLPEFDALYENLNAVEYLKIFSEIYRLEKSEAERRIYKLLEELKLPEDKQVGEFSKGMKRKLSIARTLLHDPDYLIYDEPTSGLDPSTSLFVTEYIRDLKGRNKAIVFSAHNMFYVEYACDKLLIIRKGKVLYFGELEILRNQMKKYFVRYRINGKEFEEVSENAEELNKLIKEINEDGGEILSIESFTPRLEEIYFSLM